MNNEYDIWNPLANLLAEMIEKYASELDLDNLPSVEISKQTEPNLAQSIEISKKHDIIIVDLMSKPTIYIIIFSIVGVTYTSCK